MDLIAFHDMAAVIMDPLGRAVVAAVDFVRGTHQAYGLVADGVLALIAFKLVRYFLGIRSWIIDYFRVFFDLRMRDLAIVMSEAPIELAVGDVKITGRVDEVRTMENGDWVVGDIKTPLHHRVTMEDIAELSINRHVIARRNPRVTVRANGYFRLIDDESGNERFMVVRLHDDKWFEDLIKSYATRKADDDRNLGVAAVEPCMNCRFAGQCYKLSTVEANPECVVAEEVETPDFFATRHNRINRWFNGDGFGIRRWDDR